MADLFPRHALGGSVFWIVGLASAWRLAPVTTDKGPWPSLLLIALATWKLDPLGSLVHRLGYDSGAWHVGFKFQHLAVLPVLTWLFLIVAKRTIPRAVTLEVITWGIPFLFLGWHCFRGTLTPELILPVTLIAIAGSLRAWRPSLLFWRGLAAVGAISYGIYAIGYPIQWYVRTLLPEYSGHLGYWLFRLLISLTLTFALAWWLERRVQPCVREFFTTPQK